MRRLEPKGPMSARLSTQATPRSHIDMMSDINSAMSGIFGIESLRPGQLDVLQRVLEGQNTLAIMPTGAGKSLCYQLPAVLLPGTTVVVSPILALMKDQCDGLLSRGIAAVQLNSALSALEMSKAWELIEQGTAKVVLTTPEQIADPDLITALNNHKVSLLVIDEAHCISQWGHDFRPAFLEIAPAVRLLSNPTVLALTATAKPEVSSEITRMFSILPDGVVRTSAYRRNLELAVEQLGRSADRLPRALELVSAYPGSGIVYTSTVKSAEDLYKELAFAGESVGLYHGRMPAAERVQIQDAFMDGRIRVMVATNAFGLGIDKADTRFVLHYQMPSSVDTYYQEAGRAGRDGNEAQCTLLYVRQDRVLQQFFKSGRYPTTQDLKAVLDVFAKSQPSKVWDSEGVIKAAGRSESKTSVSINLLRTHKVLRRARSGRLTLAKLADDLALEKMLISYHRRRERDNDTLEAMVAYSQSGRCRWSAVLETLGEQPEFTSCGHCDNCRRLANLAKSTPSISLTDQPIEIPRPPAPLVPGARVRARRYGEGRVTDSGFNAVTVEFPNGVSRTFLPEYVRAIGNAKKRQSPASLPKISCQWQAPHDCRLIS